MSEPSSIKDKEKPLDDLESRKTQILNLIKRKPMRWGELKNTTKLSGSTLFRILSNLEGDKIISKELKNKKLHWILTAKGDKKIKESYIAHFIRTATESLTDGLIDYKDWRPRQKPLGEDKKVIMEVVRAQPPDPEDAEYELLRQEYLKNLLTETLGNNLLKRFRKEEPLFSTVVFPYIYTSNEPFNPSGIKQLCETFVEKIVDEREQLYISSLPKDDSLIDISKSYAKDSHTNKLVLVFEIELTAHKEKLEELLETRKSQFPLKGEKET